MIKHIKVLLPLAGIVIAITACTDNLDPASETITNSDPNTAEVETTPPVDVCENPAILDVAFPRQEPVDGPREVMEAELVGDLVEIDGCLRVVSFYNDGSYLPVWPPEFILDMENEKLMILDGGGNVVGRVGEEIYMGGGTGSENAIPACIRTQITAECGGPYWVVGEGVRPNIQYDSDLIQLALIETPDRTAILLHKKPILDEWIEEPASISGILRLYSPGRCPRLLSESGHTDYLPIWPPDYSLQFTDGLIEILNGSGEVVAQEGGEIGLNGGAITHRWDSKDYRQLYYDIPGDCTGPYWIVGE